ncbi:glycine-rich domain-containing protein [Hyphomonas sp.]|uniref:glycine-rich domain-containing protein n=1 Tax=Hyphomonas sp. TaxID=87 RepID=UPI0025B8844E|nr:hypothetical protein [Hyphomonas sp.]
MSTIKVNTIETRTGSTLTLGKSGDTVSIASGASTSGMGRTGTVDWQTAIKTDSFTAVSGEGYFVDTADGTPFKNYTTTVATGTLYLVGGSGNVFNLDGSQQTSLSLLKGKTYRFTQSDSSNDGHQLIISTSNSTTLGTFQAGIVSSGITYYIDGSATQSNWLNTTTFNAGTTRYIEFKPSTTGTFYFGCYNHGIGMGGAITTADLTVTLPSSPAVGSIVSVSDYSKNAATNNIIITRNGSNIDAATDDLPLSTSGSAVTLVYADSTKGWKPVHSNEITGGPKYISASGGDSVCTSGNFKIHTFTSPGTFEVTCGGNSSGSNTVDYLVVAGGGSGGGRYGGGGGGGGYRESSGSASGCYTRSPLGACVSALPVSVTTYPITVGAGATGVPAVPGNIAGNRGSNSIFSTITSTGGGAGSGQTNKPSCVPGGSGGGGPYGTSNPLADGGTGNTPPVTPAQGQPGGRGYVPNAPYATGGGGGATEAGVNATSGNAGRGGAGGTSCITGSPVGRSGGGGGSGENGAGPNNAGAASPCGSGTAGAGSNTNSSSATANRGGGSGAAYHPGPSSSSGSGGSGVVIIRYRYQ